MGCHYPYSYCQLFPKTLWPAPCAKCKNEGKIKDLIPDQEPSQSAVNSTFETLSYFPLDHDTEIKINIQGAAGGLILQTCELSQKLSKGRFRGFWVRTKQPSSPVS